MMTKALWSWLLVFVLASVSQKPYLWAAQQSRNTEDFDRGRIDTNSASSLTEEVVVHTLENPFKQNNRGNLEFNDYGGDEIEYEPVDELEYDRENNNNNNKIDNIEQDEEEENEYFFNRISKEIDDHVRKLLRREFLDSVMPEWMEIEFPKRKVLLLQRLFPELKEEAIRQKGSIQCEQERGVEQALVSRMIGALQNYTNVVDDSEVATRAAKTRVNEAVKKAVDFLGNKELTALSIVVPFMVDVLERSNKILQHQDTVKTFSKPFKKKHQNSNNDDNSFKKT